MTKYFDGKLHIWSIQVLAVSLELVLGRSLLIRAGLESGKC
jgi:hypothetical protein